jgi:nitroreductase
VTVGAGQHGGCSLPPDKEERKTTVIQADLFEIMYTTRAMRRLKPDPVPSELVRDILRAGTAAPNGGNQQHWRFLVVIDADVKRRIQVYYQRGFEQHVRDSYLDADLPPGVDRAAYMRQLDAVEYLTTHLHEAPVWIVPCQRDGTGPVRRSFGASIYPAVQNMLLAARALGLGATLTSRHTVFQKEVDEILGLPPDVHSYAILPIGYPLGTFGPTRRAPLEHVVYGDRWGEPAAVLEVPAVE